jgi:ribosomal protein L10
MTKKNKTILKTKNFFREYPIILLLQHNNLSVKEWSRLRIDIKQLDSVNMLIVKNSIVEHIVSTEKVLERNISHSMFQGPCLAIGCLEFSQFSKIIKMFKITSKFLVIGAIVNKKLLTHLDLNKLLTINNNVYNSLVNNFSQSNDLYNLLQNSLKFQILQQIPIDLINCLSFLKNSK